MKAKSEALRTRAVNTPTRAKRLSHEDRHQQIVDRAVEFFAEYGLTGQTRQLAAACGVSQRLLYYFFPNKSSLVTQVYEQGIANSFEPDLLDVLSDSNLDVRERVLTFYEQYTRRVLTRRWLRLFFYVALSENRIAELYTSSVLSQLIDALTTMITREKGLDVASVVEEVRGQAHVMHGAIVHSAIRVEIFRTSLDDDHLNVIRTAVGNFLAAVACLPKESSRHRRRSSKAAQMPSQH